MKRKYIVALVCILFVFFLCLLIINNHNNRDVLMKCTSEMAMVGSETKSEYIFKGTKDVVETEELSVYIHAQDSNLIENYREIISSKKECSDISYSDDYISYKCNYDLVKEDYYEDLEDDEGRLLFSVIKENFENDNYVCEYK